MSSKRRGLGRGLDALLGGAVTASAPVQGAAKDHLRQLPVEVIRRGKYQPRSDIRPETLEELADSIRAQGVVQPIVVRTIGTHFQVSALQLTRPGQYVFDFVLQCEQALRGGVQGDTKRRQHYPPPAPIKQSHTVAFLERAYLTGNCRLGQLQRPCSRSEAALTGNGVERAQLCPVHVGGIAGPTIY